MLVYASAELFVDIIQFGVFCRLVLIIKFLFLLHEVGVHWLAIFLGADNLPYARGDLIALCALSDIVVFDESVACPLEVVDAVSHIIDPTRGIACTVFRSQLESSLS